MLLSRKQKHQQNEKATPEMKKLQAIYLKKKKYRKCTQLIDKKKKKDYKLNRGITWTFFQWRYQTGQYIYENMLNITNHDMQWISGKYVTKPNELFTPISMAIIKNLGDKCWWGCGEKGFFVHCWWECKLLQLQ